jgi:hypothetical protein
MPEIDKKVLICWVNFKNHQTVEQGFLGESFTRRIKRFIDARYRNVNGTVTHWMPLPEPPIDV